MIYGVYFIAFIRHKYGRWSSMTFETPKELRSYVCVTVLWDVIERPKIWIIIWTSHSYREHWIYLLLNQLSIKRYVTSVAVPFAYIHDNRIDQLTKWLGIGMLQISNEVNEFPKWISPPWMPVSGIVPFTYLPTTTITPPPKMVSISKLLI